MAIIVIALHIQIVKKEKWKEIILNLMVGPNKKDTDSIRENVGVH